MFRLYRLHRLIHEIWGLTIQKRGHLGCRMFQVYPVPSSVKTCCSASGSHPLVEGLPGHPAWVSEVPWTNMSAFIKISHWMDSASSFIMFHIYMTGWWSQSTLFFPGVQTYGKYFRLGIRRSPGCAQFASNEQCRKLFGLEEGEQRVWHEHTICHYSYIFIRTHLATSPTLGRGPRSEVRGSRSEVRGPRFELRVPRSEVRGPRSEVRGPRFEVRGPRSEVRGPRFEVRGPRSEVRCPRFEVRGPRPEVRDPRSEVRGPRSEVRGSRSEVRGSRSEVRGPRSEVRGPRSEVRGPRSEVRGSRSEVRGSRFEVRGPRFEVRGPRFEVRGPRQSFSAFAIRQNKVPLTLQECHELLTMIHFITGNNHELLTMIHLSKHISLLNQQSVCNSPHHILTFSQLTVFRRTPPGNQKRKICPTWDTSSIKPMAPTLALLHICGHLSRSNIDQHIGPT